MPNKRSAATLLHALTSTLRSGLFRQTTIRQPRSLDHETLPLEDQAAVPTQSEKRSALSVVHLGHGLMLVWAIAAAVATGANLKTVQYWERQTQSLMFRVRGAVAPPDDVVILAIDDDTLLQMSGGQLLRRGAYARALEKVMQAGAKTVAVNLLLDLPGSNVENASIDCGDPNLPISEDDRQLQKVLQRYDGRITLAVDLDRFDNRQGEQMRVALPYCPFRTPQNSLGLVQFPREANDRLHRLGSESIKTLRRSPELGMILDEEKIVSFADATLRSANIQTPPPQGENIFFYGVDGTFSKNTIPFWNVLHTETWNSDYLQQGRVFKDKIVLIGSTASKVGSMPNTPFGAMTGVEMQANAIATLLQNKSIRSAVPDPTIAGLMVFFLVVGAGILQIQAKQPTARLGWAVAISLFWSGIGYALFTQGFMIVSIAAPCGAIVLVGMSYLGTGLADEYRNKRQFRKTLKHYAGSPLVQEIIEQQADYKDLLEERTRETLSKKIGGRYQITMVLGSGGFGETYIAEDTQRPGDPQCVVKQLRPTSNNPKHLQLARRLFKSEANTLQLLGEHDQIPRLLAYFEEDGEFYLVQEFIAGAPLSEEVTIGRHLPEVRIVSMLQELLYILSFVHDRNVIHRDIKPSNIIKRFDDGKLVLIDFGAVKELHHQITDADSATATIGIGTQGYMPPEQCAGNPRFSSDLYAVGMIGIQALTGLPPSQLKEDPQTGEIIWRDRAIVSGSLAVVLAKMVHYDFRQRYQSANEVLQDLAGLKNLSTLTLPAEFFDLDEDENVTTTRPWPHTFGEEPPTEPPPLESR